MKPKRLSEVRALLAQPEFQDWWRKLLESREQAKAAFERYDELLSQVTSMDFRAELTQKNAIDTLYRAGECEDSAANMLVTAQELENRSFSALADFEEQRFKTSELWYRLGAAEKNLQEKKELHERQKNKRTEGELKLAEKHHRAMSEEYEREMARKNRLWDEVERIWAMSAETSLLLAEQRVRGKKIRRQAESLFQAAEEKKRQANQMRAEADRASAAMDQAQRQIDALLQQAREQFGCAVGTDFLYFRHRDNQKLAFCVALVDDADSYNIEVKPLSVYVVDRQRGVAFLEPARHEAPSLEDGDRRFEQYFLTGRKGEVRRGGSAT